MDFERSKIIDNDRIEQKNDEFFSPGHIKIKTSSEKKNPLDLPLEQMIDDEYNGKKKQKVKRVKKHVSSKSDLKDLKSSFSRRNILTTSIYGFEILGKNTGFSDSKGR
ncbi:hypothetical protein KHM09_20540 [Leptospira borgpetersenii]|nr:hypothetical protein KHM09_20540 [Leptospira borgpetersenii]